MLPSLTPLSFPNPLFAALSQPQFRTEFFSKIGAPLSLSLALKTSPSGASFYLLSLPLPSLSFFLSSLSSLPQLDSPVDYPLLDHHISIFEYVDKPPHEVIGAHYTISVSLPSNSSSVFKTHIYYAHTGTMLNTPSESLFYPHRTSSMPPLALDFSPLALAPWNNFHHIICFLKEELAIFQQKNAQATFALLDSLSDLLLKIDFPDLDPSPSSIAGPSPSPLSSESSDFPLAQDLFLQAQEALSLAHSLSLPGLSSLKKKFSPIQAWFRCMQDWEDIAASSLIEQEAISDQGQGRSLSLSCQAPDRKDTPPQESSTSMAAPSPSRTDTSSTPVRHETQALNYIQSRASSLFAKARTLLQLSCPETVLSQELMCRWFIETPHQLLNQIEVLRSKMHYYASFLPSNSQRVEENLKKIDDQVRATEVHVAKIFLDLHIYPQKESCIAAVLPQAMHLYFARFASLLVLQVLSNVTTSPLAKALSLHLILHWTLKYSHPKGDKALLKTLNYVRQVYSKIQNHPAVTFLSNFHYLCQVPQTHWYRRLRESCLEEQPYFVELSSFYSHPVISLDLLPSAITQLRISQGLEFSLKRTSTPPLTPKEILTLGFQFLLLFPSSPILEALIEDYTSLKNYATYAEAYYDSFSIAIALSPKDAQTFQNQSFELVFHSLCQQWIDCLLAATLLHFNQPLLFQFRQQRVSPKSQEYLKKQEGILKAIASCDRIVSMQLAVFDSLEPILLAITAINPAQIQTSRGRDQLYAITASCQIHLDLFHALCIVTLMANLTLPDTLVSILDRFHILSVVVSQIPHFAPHPAFESLRAFNALLLGGQPVTLPEKSPSHPWGLSSKPLLFGGALKSLGDYLDTSALGGDAPQERAGPSDPSSSSSSPLLLSATETPATRILPISKNKS